MLDGRRVTYTGLEPLTNEGDAADVEFTLTTGADEALLEDLGGGNLRLTSQNGTLEVTTFIAPGPAGSITINAAGGNDVISVGNLSGSFTGRLRINTGNGRWTGWCCCPA